MTTSVLAGYKGESQPLEEVLSEMQKKYDVVFSYNTKAVKGVTVEFELREYEKLEAAIKRVLKDTHLKYKYLGLNFYVIHVDNMTGKRKMRKLKRKIQQIKRLGNQEDLMIYNQSGLSEIKTSKYKTISGRITDDIGEPLIGAAISLVGTQKVTTTDQGGNYELVLTEEASLLEVSYTGYNTKVVDVSDEQNIDIQLKKGLFLESLTVFGSRSTPSTYFNSAVGIDHISIDKLETQGENTLDEKLVNIIPSFNSGQHPVSDASAHFNPIGLRGLFPSRTLVLLNGKRKNTSALLYSYVTASRGEVGVDLKSINADAIQTVEVLRDGAAAQYGSDAIAGVINFSLKKKIAPFLNMGYSTTHKLDGTCYNASGGFSLDILDKGFTTFTLGYMHQQRSQRAGVITSAEDESAFWKNEKYNVSDYQDYLGRNPSAGFQVGLPDIRSFNVTINSEYKLNSSLDTELYAFGTFMDRSGKSPQFARGPYWVEGFEEIYSKQDYFLPEMAPKINDVTFTAGIRHNLVGWKVDVSSTLGRNVIKYFINNSFNQSLGVKSPKDFYNGAHSFTHLVNNIDVNKAINLKPIEFFTLAFGMEQRFESFKSEAGEFASYGDGTPDKLDRIGSESFSGLTPNDALTGTRHNIGFYGEVNAGITSNLQIGGATRFERYSDFGNNISWKLNALVKAIPNRLNLRASISNGFRAPALHQIYYSSTTTTLTPQGIVQNRILNNLDPALGILQIPKLKAETSFNTGMGLALKLTDKFSLSSDFYRIKVKDRVVLSGQIGRQSDKSSPINELLDNTNTASTGFFLNAVNTVTSGIDIVFNLSDLEVGRGTVKSTLAANFSRTTVDNINPPDFAEGRELIYEIFSREDISRLETWRPRQKILSNTTYERNNFSTTVGISYFGPVTYRHPINPEDDATYTAKTTVDWSISHRIGSNINWQIGIQNLFNIYPDTFSKAYQDGTPNDRSIDFVGRFNYPWQTIQIGIDGMRGFSKIMMKF